MNCIECKEQIYDGSPYEETEKGCFCGDCAFMNGIIGEKELLKHHYFFADIPNLRALIHNGKVYVGTNFEWERDSRKRNSPDYTKWRKTVFERDGYTCQECGQQGGNLNAHHIKPYSKYKELRTDVNNGITLCVDCHKKVHRKR